MTGPGTSGAVEAMLRSAPLVDGHNDLPWAARASGGYDLDQLALHGGRPDLHTDLARLRRGCVGAQFWSVYVPSTWSEERAVVATFEQVDFVHRLVARYPDRLALARTADEVRASVSAGRIASLLGAEGGHSIGSSLAVLRSMAALGVRYLTLTHNDNTAWADSATDTPRSGGLAPFGREVVAELNRLGVLVDLSHVATTTMHDALDTSSAPVIFSHSCARALVDNPRNVDDAVLTRMAAAGGVCMVAFVPEFVTEPARLWGLEQRAFIRDSGIDLSEDWAAFLAATASFEQTHQRPLAGVADVADHIEHVREVAGVAHVGIGADFDGCDRTAEGLRDVGCYPALFEELLARGWSERDCQALAGGNVLRVLADAEQVARRAGAGIRQDAAVSAV
jgi:membrane dipeptidase